MAVIIGPKYESAGEMAGKSFQNALSQLADIKMRQILQNQEMVRQGKAYNQLLSNYGYSPEEGERIGQTIAGLPPKIQESALSDLIKRRYIEQQQEQIQQTQPAMPDTNIPQQYAKAQFTQPSRTTQGYVPFQTPQLMDKAIAREQKSKEAALSREFREKESSAIRKENAFKQTAKLREEVQNLEKGAIDSDMRLGKLYNLAKKGNLVHPLTYSALKKVGLDLPAFMNADTQQFDELVTNFLRDAKNIFGSRVTNYEMSTFIKSIPSLQNTDAGKMKIIKNLKIYNAATKLRAQEMRKIIKENKNIPPLDLREQLEERIGGKLDKLSKLFAEV